VPNITQKGLSEWSAKDIAYFLETGQTPDGDTAGGAMVRVIKNTSQLTPEDRAAIAEYVKIAAAGWTDHRAPRRRQRATTSPDPGARSISALVRMTDPGPSKSKRIYRPFKLSKQTGRQFLGLPGSQELFLQTKPGPSIPFPIRRPGRHTPPSAKGAGPAQTTRRHQNLLA